MDFNEVSCELCASKGIVSKKRLSSLNYDEDIYMCENVECMLLAYADLSKTICKAKPPPNNLFNVIEGFKNDESNKFVNARKNSLMPRINDRKKSKINKINHLDNSVNDLNVLTNNVFDDNSLTPNNCYHSTTDENVENFFSVCTTNNNESHPSFNIPLSTEFSKKYPQWTRSEALNCLNVTLNLVVHNNYVKKELPHLKESSMVKMLLSDYQRAFDLCNSYDIDTSTDEKIADLLRNVRNQIMEYLKGKLSFETRELKNPVIALLHLLHEEILQRNFRNCYKLEFHCESCGFCETKSSQTILLTLPNIAFDFSVLNAIILTSCPICNAQNQKKKLIFNRLTNCLMLHVENGLLNSNVKQYDFEFAEIRYKLACIIVYERNFHNFIAWIRNIENDLWMECDDLKSRLSFFQHQFPNLSNQSECHVLVWERSCDVTDEIKELDRIYNGPVTVDPNTETTLMTEFKEEKSEEKAGKISTTIMMNNHEDIWKLEDECLIIEEKVIEIDDMGLEKSINVFDVQNLNSELTSPFDSSSVVTDLKCEANMMNCDVSCDNLSVDVHDNKFGEESKQLEDFTHENCLTTCENPVTSNFEESQSLEEKDEEIQQFLNNPEMVYDCSFYVCFEDVASDYKKKPKKRKSNAKMETVELSCEAAIQFLTKLNKPVEWVLCKEKLTNEEEEEAIDTFANDSVHKFPTKNFSKTPQRIVRDREEKKIDKKPEKNSLSPFIVSRLKASKASELFQLAINAKKPALALPTKRVSIDEATTSTTVANITNSVTPMSETVNKMNGKIFPVLTTDSVQLSRTPFRFTSYKSKVT